MKVSLVHCLQSYLGVALASSLVLKGVLLSSHHSPHPAHSTNVSSSSPLSVLASALARFTRVLPIAASVSAAGACRCSSSEPQNRCRGMELTGRGEERIWGRLTDPFPLCSPSCPHKLIHPRAQHKPACSRTIAHNTHTRVLASSRNLSNWANLIGINSFHHITSQNEHAITKRAHGPGRVAGALTTGCFCFTTLGCE